MDPVQTTSRYSANRYVDRLSWDGVDGVDDRGDTRDEAKGVGGQQGHPTEEKFFDDETCNLFEVLNPQLQKNEASSKDFQKVYQPGEGVYSRDLAWTKWPEGVPFDGPTAELCQDHPLRVGQECHLEDEEYVKSAKSQFI